jgi:uncharacterized secreted protein with C-terminal beta-propeller domain
MRTYALISTAAAALAGAVAAAALLAPAPAGAAGAKTRLQPFRSCGELAGYVKRNALPLVGPYGLGFAGGRGVVTDTVAAAPARSAGVPGVDFSTTNVQEGGVDEPDLVKSNGSHLFVLAHGGLQVVDVGGSRPRLAGSLPLEQGWSHELLLDGEQLLVVSSGGAGIQPLPSDRLIAPIGPQASVFTRVDVSDPARPRVVETLTVDGSYLTARLVNGSIRVVVVSAMPARLQFVTPPSPDQGAVATATTRNRAVVQSSRARSWLPGATLRNVRTGARSTRSLVQCRHVSRPASFSGLGTLTVLTIDLDKGLQPVDSDAIVTDGQTVYASPQRLVVATQRWANRPTPDRPDVVVNGLTTALHTFDISLRERTEYRASGEVPGFLLNQWSLSEHKGLLRVASTEMPSWFTGNAQDESESAVTIFREEAGRLVSVGRVGDLGRGERIYAVRFMGDTGYVVTFRQVDPLYTLDLTDPAQPRKLGELKILGFSSYLHPVGEELLLGIGQDASEEGRVLGSQLSLFDIADLRNPSRLHQKTIGPGSSEAEYDHHAFLYWPAKQLTVLPVQSYAAQPGDLVPFGGVIAYRVGRTAGIQELGRIAHLVEAGTDAAGTIFPGGVVPIRRSLVVGTTLLTVSDAGVKANSLDTLAELGWVPFT